MYRLKCSKAISGYEWDGWMEISVNNDNDDPDDDDPLRP